MPPVTPALVTVADDETIVVPLPLAFSVVRLPLLTFTAAVPETLAVVKVGPAKVVVPPDSAAVGIVSKLFIVTRPPETLSAVEAADAPEPTVTPLVRLLLTTFSVGTLPAVILTTVLVPEIVATVPDGPAKLVVPPEAVKIGIAFVLLRLTTALPLTVAVNALANDPIVVLPPLALKRDIWPLVTLTTVLAA